MVFRLRPLPHEQRVLLFCLLAGLPAVTTALILLWTGGVPANVQWPLTILITLTWIGLAAAVRERVASPLRTLANLLEAMREGDYSIRARGARGSDALAEAMRQVNMMSATLRAQRLGALEATTLLRTVMEEIEVAVFAFDGEQKLRLVNRAGERLLAQPSQRLLARDAEALGLQDHLIGATQQTVQRSFPGGASGRWGISRTTFREGGLPHQLLVVTDLTRLLREEELKAWQRIVRVLGHELNNSLAPIKSIAGSLETILRREPRPSDWEEDMLSGLTVIGARSESLTRFMTAYAKLARLPQPALRPVAVAALVRRVVELEKRMELAVMEGPAITIEADSDQLEQALINLLKNAVDASLETGGGVRIGWRVDTGHVVIVIRDEGQGLASTSNLFVPFFTTKPGGSGIGLVLSRQIAEAHGGSLTLANAVEGPGCEACLSVPIVGVGLGSQV